MNPAASRSANDPPADADAPLQLTATQIAVLAKVRRRMLPILMFCYFAAFLDRVNIGIASLYMNADLHLTNVQFGLGAGLFFVGYVIFEVPSNLLLARFGARRWIPRILVTWGIVSACMALAWDHRSFYALRVLLGIAEAGFFPGMLFYLTLWFPRSYRARVYSLLSVAVPLASVVGSPLSAWILHHFQDIGGLRNWQWMFIIEGMPAVVMGFVFYRFLPSRPEEATFLNAHERASLVELMHAEQQAQQLADTRAGRQFSFARLAGDKRVWAMCLVQMCLIVSSNSAAIWMPQFVNAFNHHMTLVEIGLVSAVPPLAACVAILFSGWNADRTGKRVAHVAIPFLIATAGFVLAACSSSDLMRLIGLVIGSAGISASIPNVWYIPSALLSGTASAAGLALINSVGSVGGFFGPYAIGTIRDLTGSFDSSLLFLAAVVALAAVVVTVLGYRMRFILKSSDLARHGR
jgi:ACS family tartrate transporter-like MFS transporter